MTLLNVAKQDWGKSQGRCQQSWKSRWDWFPDPAFCTTLNAGQREVVTNFGDATAWLLARPRINSAATSLFVPQTVAGHSYHAAEHTFQSQMLNTPLGGSDIVDASSFSYIQARML